MNALRPSSFGRQLAARHGYLVVLFVVILAFAGVAAAMQVMILISVTRTSRAFDAYRQGAAEMTRVENAVAEAAWAKLPPLSSVTPDDLATVLQRELDRLAGGETPVVCLSSPAALPRITTFPTAAYSIDPLTSVPDDMQAFQSPELALMIGSKVSAYPELPFEFAVRRTVLDADYTYRMTVSLRYLAVPLTRFSITAYELPSEIGNWTTAVATGPTGMNPAGLMPGRDRAFVNDVVGAIPSLPYLYRRRAALAATYERLFSREFVDRVTELAGITHVHDLGATSGTAVLEGMSKAGNVTSWDIGRAGRGAYGSISLSNTTAVIFTEDAGMALRFTDSIGRTDQSPFCVVVLGPTSGKAGQLTLEFASIQRPVVVIACNVHIAAGAQTTVNGALFLDPACSWSPGAEIGLGHLSYWAGSTTIPASAVRLEPLPAAIDSLTPRAVYVATRSRRL